MSWNRDTGGGVASVVEDTTPQLGGPLDTNGMAINTSYATVASHATTSAIWAAAGNIINFTGTETITALPAADRAGSQRILICAGACIWTHAGALTVQGGATYTCAAGDVVIVTATTTTAFKITILPQAGLLKLTGGTMSGILKFFNVAAPSAAIADTVQVWAQDRQGVAGKSALHMVNEEGFFAPIAFANLTYRTSAGDVSPGLNEIGNNYLEISATGTVTLPAVPNIAQTSVGSLVGAVITIDSTSAAVIHVDPNAADRVVMHGVAQADGEKISCDAVAGNSVTLIVDSVAGWRVLATTGVWVNGG